MFEKILKGLLDKDSMKKDFDEYKKQYPELAGDLSWEDVEPKSYDGIDPIESPINFGTLNTLTKEYYSPQARVNRMLQHAKAAAEKGSWWCNIPEVGEEEIALLKGYGFRLYSKQVRNRERFDSTHPEYLTQFSLNWADVKPNDASLTEV